MAINRTRKSSGKKSAKDAVAEPQPSPDVKKTVPVFPIVGIGASAGGLEAF